MILQTKQENHIITKCGFRFDERLITLKEAAKILGCSLPTLYARIESGQYVLSHVRLTASIHRLKLSEVCALLPEAEQISIYEERLKLLNRYIDITTACNFLRISQSQFYKMMNPDSPDKFTFNVIFKGTKRKAAKEDIYNYIDTKTFSC